MKLRYDLIGLLALFFILLVLEILTFIGFFYNLRLEISVLLIIDLLVLFFYGFKKKILAYKSNIPKDNIENKEIRIERYIIGVLYAVVFLVAGYMILTGLIPNIFLGNTYSINADDNLLTSSLKSFYIDNDNVLGEKTVINGDIARPIVSSQSFNLVFTPKSRLPDNSTAELEMNFVGSGTEVYMHNNLIIPNLDEYELVADYKDDAVYLRKDIMGYNKTGLVKKDTPEDFIYYNFPGASIFSFGEMKMPVLGIEDYRDKNSVINTVFRSDLKLAVYIEGNLSLNFVKQDLNYYLGGDEYTIEITDYHGNLIDMKVIDDDGDKKNSGKLGSGQKIKIIEENLPRSIYYISFIKDSNNDYPDSTIKNIAISSNKVLIVGNSLPYEGFEFYTKANALKNIGFLYWQNDKNQTINIKSTETKVIDLNESWI